MRINLTKKDLVNSIYMQIGFSKQISANLLEEFLDLIIQNLNSEKKIKISKFGTFSTRNKNARVGRNPKTGVEAAISERRVITFRASDHLKEAVNKSCK